MSIGRKLLVLRVSLAHVDQGQQRSGWFFRRHGVTDLNSSTYLQLLTTVALIVSALFSKTLFQESSVPWHECLEGVAGLFSAPSIR